MTRAICIATGASLTPEDVDYCKGKGKIYAIKEAMFLAPWADVLYAADEDWWDFYKGCPDFLGERWTCSEKPAQKWGLNYIPYRADANWSNDPSFVATGGHSGFQALNLAALQGATEIVLLGYDLGFSGNKKHYWTGQRQRPVRGSDYNSWIKRFYRALPEIKVPIYNASRFSYLKCFPQVKLEDVL